ncbi:MAG: AAA family ATPase [Halanaerobiales bacterium]|nr:AAA family ATPase [Halanaerobiales bacterium]
MLKSLCIENFKCFVDTQVDFAPLTLLVGGNGAGKSTIIQSLLLARQSIEAVSVLKGDLELFDVRLNGPYLLKLGQVSNVLSSNASSII